MNEAKTGTLVRIIRALRSISRNKWLFFAVFLLCFSASFSVLASLDLLPERKIASPQIEEEVAASVVLASEVFEDTLTPADPERIVIKDVGVDVEVLNPTSTRVSDLDEALLDGVVRYPTSAKLGEKGNVVLFGHSSYLPVVQNDNFKAFNGIEKLRKGDTITVLGGGYEYTYTVEAVDEMKAHEGVIPLTKTGNTLTLATCNSFGTPQDRFVVTATLTKTQRTGS